MKFPAQLITTLRDIHADADAWLEALPNTLARLEAAWSVRVTGLVPQLSYHLVAYAERADGTPCTLKLCPPSDELAREGRALAFYNGDGICRLLERDDTVGALLLERIVPGVSLQERWSAGVNKQVNKKVDETHTRIAAELMVKLWRRAPEKHAFRTLESWTAAVRAYEGVQIPQPMLERARGLWLELSPTASPVLLHADLHHGNILSNVLSTETGYTAIDPKGIVGAKGYEVGSYLQNPITAAVPELRELLPRRVAVLAEVTGLEPHEIVAWGYLYAVLSACWSLEDHGGGHERALEVAGALHKHG